MTLRIASQTSDPLCAINKEKKLKGGDKIKKCQVEESQFFPCELKTTTDRLPVT